MLAPRFAAGEWVAVKNGGARESAREHTQAEGAWRSEALPRRHIARKALPSAADAVLSESGWHARSERSSHRAPARPSGETKRSGRPTVVVPDLNPWSTTSMRRAYYEAEQAESRLRAAAARSARATAPGFDYYFDIRGFDRARRVPFRRPSMTYRYR